jgi:hypothetical protein
MSAALLARRGPCRTGKPSPFFSVLLEVLPISNVPLQSLKCLVELGVRRALRRAVYLLV